nr:MAG TPA: hypothetical protein [Caudoviricetes sp.]
MTNREMTVNMLKLIGEELIDAADDLVPDTDEPKDIDVRITIPAQTNGKVVIPTIQVDGATRSRVEIQQHS